MTIWEKICGEVSDKIEILIEKNRVAAVKNRLKLALARENKQLERVYMQIGRACFDGRRLSEEPEMEDFYHQVDALQQKIARLQKTLEEVEQNRENNVIAVDFGGAQAEEEPLEREPAEDAEQEEPAQEAGGPAEPQRREEPEENR